MSFTPILPKGPPAARLPGKPGSSSLPRRENVTMACNPCRISRKKCDGKKPSCSICTARDRVCEYAEFDGRAKLEATTAIQKLQKKIEDLEKTVQQLRSDGSLQATDPLQSSPETRGLVSENIKGKRPVRDAASPPPLYTTTWSTYIPSTAIATLDGGNDRYNSGFGFIPTEIISYRALSIFFTSIGILTYIDTEEITQVLINSVYDNTSIEVDRVCELCAIAAVGCQYDSQGVSFPYKDVYFRHAQLLLFDTLKKDTQRAIRIIICLSTYLILGNTKGARALLGCGLWLARQLVTQQRPTSALHGHETLQIIRLHKILITLESVNLDYTPNFIVEEAYSTTEIDPQTGTGQLTITPSMIQSHYHKLAVLSASIHTEMRSTQNISWGYIEQASNTLDTWRQQLPDTLQLHTLLSENNEIPAPRRQALLLLHMTYLESRVLLYRRYIRQYTSLGIINIATDIRLTCSGFVHQLARIISVIYEDKCSFVQCWILIHASFHSSTLLLVELCQCLWHSDSPTLIIDNIKYTKLCFQVLQFGGTTASAAVDISSLLGPLFERLCLLSQELDSSGSSAKPRLMQIQSVLNHQYLHQTEITEILDQITDLTNFSSDTDSWE
ncbi:hypothetical protein BJX63DRAFT_89140 [Aspergillus granulosus]|uniref:Zn(2)-C6 fungal-type domain-containing protein n=1 Tax=Aspergillus granulosus TaxID=176169 RepID=A0ABR4GX80_9EURO